MEGIAQAYGVILGDGQYQTGWARLFFFLLRLVYRSDLVLPYAATTSRWHFFEGRVPAGASQTALLRVQVSTNGKDLLVGYGTPPAGGGWFGEEKGLLTHHMPT